MPQLKDIQLEEVSLVDKGANPGAHIVLMKAESFDGAMSDIEADRKIYSMMDAFHNSFYSICEDKEITNKAAAIRDTVAQFHRAVAELAKEMDMSTDNADILKKYEELTEQFAKMQSDLEAKDAEIETLKSEVEAAKADTDDTDDINKADLPEAVQKKLEEADAVQKAMQSRIEKMEDEKLESEWIGKCSTEETGKLMHKVAKLDAEVAEEVYAVVKAAQAAAEEAGLLKELGDSGNENENTVLEKVNKLADEIVKSEKCTHAVAVTKVLQQNPELYGEYRKELN